MRFFYLLIVALCFFVCCASDIKAQIVIIDKSGELRWNVLSDKVVLPEAQASEIAITKIANLSYKFSNPAIELSKIGSSLNMIVSSDNKEKVFEVTNFGDKILEIEERPAISKISVSVQDGKFVIAQGETKALTSLPILIDPKEARVSLKTSYGESNLTIFPQQAVFTALRSRIVSLVTNDSEIIDENGKIFYKLSGEKHFSFYSFYTYKVPVQTYISAVTGEIVKIDSPTWYKYLSFLFV
ncbi:MAG: hypothetical protein NZM26_03930 [Patescibacteria group bacterium]|nr:hypothetical protein [Patescibacteria group bacterium]